MDREQLRERRKKLGLIQQHLANLLGVTAGVLQSWEVGRTKIPTITEQNLQNIEDKFEKIKARKAKILFNITLNIFLFQ